ncbi:MAG: type I restriction-modification system subunit M [Flavobacteriales bacterium]|nr:type I restriction-modification system subunit M [Flavobacteriales bacterium]
MRKDAGVDGDAQRISQMVWMLFLKIFADKEEEWELTVENYESPLPVRLKWDTWASDDEGLTGDELMEFINNDLFPTLKDLNIQSPQATIIRSVFEDTYNYMKNGTLFRQVINVINGFDFNNSKERHMFNEIYETILKELQSAGSSGEYYTPRAVTQFMVDMVDPQLGENILDMACGTGGFLTCSIEHVRKQVNTAKERDVLQKSIRGIEKKPLPHLLCTTNLMLHGFDLPAVKRDNMLAMPYSDWGKKDRVDVILMNPPFGGTEEDGTENNFPQKFRTKETADLFLTLIIRLLKDGGRAAVVLPDGTLFGEGVKTRIKKELLSKCNLHTIVRLPNGVFNPYTGIKTNLLFFEKGTATREIWYYDHPYPDGRKSYTKTNPVDISEFTIEKKWWNDREENDNAWKVTLKEIENKGYNLDFKNPNSEIEAQELNKDTLLNQLQKSVDRTLKIMNQLNENFN